MREYWLAKLLSMRVEIGIMLLESSGEFKEENCNAK
jgi:hypothetical protein